MSTKVTVKERAREGGRPGFHLYEDVLDEFALPENAEQPVYLQLDGVKVGLSTLDDGGASVTVVIPRELAGILGLLPSE